MDYLTAPKISVIVPAYNVEQYISKCIESIVNQTYKNLEIIIINDGSTDKTGEICEHYSKKDDRIILVNQENQGVSMARNNALDIASGDYISFVDSDDWVEPDIFHVLYDNSIMYDADISMCNYYYVDKNNKMTKADNFRHEIVAESEYKIMHFLDYIGHYTVPWNKLYNKKLFNGIRYPRNKIHEDVFITHKLIDKANKVITIPDHKYYYVQRNDSITKKPFNLSHFDIIEACIDRYNYIAAEYPNFESRFRRYIFTSLLDCIYKIYLYDDILPYKNMVESATEKVREYSTYNCGLSESQEKTLTMLFNDIKKFFIILKYQRIRTAMHSV